MNLAIATSYGVGGGGVVVVDVLEDAIVVSDVEVGSGSTGADSSPPPEHATNRPATTISEPIPVRATFAPFPRRWSLGKLF